MLGILRDSISAGSLSPIAFPANMVSYGLEWMFSLSFDRTPQFRYIASFSSSLLQKFAQAI